MENQKPFGSDEPTTFRPEQGSEKTLKEEKVENKLKLTTVAEAKTQLSESKDSGDNYVWGTRITKGSKKDFQNTLAAMDDGDAIVWG